MSTPTPAASTSRALLKRPASAVSATSPSDQAATTALMPPPPPPKRIKRPATVLAEDTYTGALAHIIRRDFFPGLDESARALEYLEALRSRDDAWIDDARRALADARARLAPGRGGAARRGGAAARGGTPLRRTTAAGTPRMTRRGSTGEIGSGAGVAAAAAADETPRGWAGDTPATTTTTTTMARGGDGDGKEGEEGAFTAAGVDVGLSLAGFQARYTSEDNESFNSLLDTQNAERQAKYAWLWAPNGLPSKRRIAQGREMENRKLLGFEDGKAQTEAKERPAMPDGHRHSVKNALMFVPDGVDEDETAAAASGWRPPANKQQDNSAAFKPPKSINHAATRFPLEHEVHGTLLFPDGRSSSTPARPASPSLSAIDDAIAGRPRRTASDLFSDLASEPPDVNENEDADGSSHSLIASEPAAHERDLTPAQMRTLIKARRDAVTLPNYGARTKSDADATRSAAAAAADNPFELRPRSRREALHHALVDRAARAKRDAAASGGDGGGTGTPSGAAPAAAAPTPRFLSSPAVGAGVGAGAGAGAGGAPQGRTPLTPAARRLLGRVTGSPVGRRVGGEGAVFGGEGGRKGKAGRAREKREWWTPAGTPKGGG
ncbi:nuclear protein DGCR14 [Lineolata rhizophorae]|uniref:Nuclear protein DGCR14 n=1 Tax=Lineolata rhizophorae TaxID=578093 RepID=A0A6A6PET9_9PEZI|nr:nuclear protein DGCR14 [Lineolata rhizophorae]